MNTILHITNKIYNSDDIEATVIECIDQSIEDGYSFPLMEAIGTIEIPKDYISLIESVDEFNDIKKDISKFKKEDDPNKKANIFQKLIDSVKKIFNWWYKVDPDKKFKTLHIILKVILIFASLYFIIFYPGARPIVSNVAARIPVGYMGTSKFLSAIAGKKTIAAILVSVPYTKISQTLRNFNKNMKYKINAKDIDKAINEYEKSIDYYNNMLDSIEDDEAIKTIKKSKLNCEIAVAQLTLIKESKNDDK